jgi:hypothetical protein
MFDADGERHEVRRPCRALFEGNHNQTADSSRSAGRLRGEMLLLRKKLSLVAVGVVLAFGAGLGAAATASADSSATYYNTQAECEQAQAQAEASTGQPYHCNATVPGTEPGAWVLAPGVGGGG